ncbi:MAG TPA: tRNA (adenosine(37)-N6)-threonylcarbamoyltransferase complex transferase subunit TsaD [Nitrospirota bacterium]
MHILGIETSCDETAASVVKDGRVVLSNVISSQIDLHKRFGGIVPELASRAHIQNILPVVHEALEASGMKLSGMDAVAVTSGPGLIGALLVGVSTAKSLAYSAGIPLIGVNHIEGHMSAVFLEHADVGFPLVLLVVSGGHTHLYLIKSCCDYEKLGQTRDDAAGEAYDKVAKLLGLGYPGGPVIDALAKEGDPSAIKFPRSMLEPGSLDFSFSGLKTAVMLQVKAAGGAMTDRTRADICASFQAAVVDVLVRKTMAAAGVTGVRTVVIGGGVAANSGLRDGLSAAADGAGVKLLLTSPGYCTDNAAMVAAAGYNLYMAGRVSGMDLNPSPNLALEIC